ncbi:hypothetical protein F5Y15DRAFT_399463 [Xylariaceae sp. FL0016]|nr:hypothetical protein F5Y15DRAFT_399463 [Xylariaceae sp. FL0016]
MSSLTYRLRFLPVDIDQAAVVELLCQALSDLTPPEIRLGSLARNPNPLEIPPTQTATLAFLRPPDLLKRQPSQNEWSLQVEGLPRPLILDSHFLAFTSLVDVDVLRHKYDCIAISGLASHPFGSWQPKVRDKSFMWIRDALPLSLPSVRTILYGYDTTLVNSNSFQSIRDIASTLANHLSSGGWHLTTGKPLLFLAHSLGGIIVKEAFRLLAMGTDRDQHVLNRFKGGIFLGVPSAGMETSDLISIVKGKVNEGLLHDLTRGSDYLRSLDDQFSGLTLTRNLSLYWAYETKTSPTVERQEDGSYSRTGPQVILVTKDSATRDVYRERQTRTFAINESHSDMAKFRRGDSNLGVVITKLRGITHDREERMVSQEPEALSDAAPQPHAPVESTSGLPSSPWNHDSHTKMMEWTTESLKYSLKIPDMSGRFETIEENFNATFDWVFGEGVPLCQWLRSDHGIFWIHGKPGSGKSTLMKFIFTDHRLWELLQRLDQSSELVSLSAGFFFHRRGTMIQKSFEGLLRSILVQVMEQEPRLANHVLACLEHRYGSVSLPMNKWSINDLRRCIEELFQQKIVRFELFLLLDALDEYDGSPDFICGVLNWLLGLQTGNPHSLRILFSSRPWREFEVRFGNYPAIQLQDHTKCDIETYCFGMIESQDGVCSANLVDIVPSIIDRAEGVFLWVKLVLQELTREASSGCQRQELAAILKSIPDDLLEYYARIVQGIPESYRWEAYVILETMARSEKQLTCEQVWELLALSYCTTWTEANRKAADLYRQAHLAKRMGAFIATMQMAGRKKFANPKLDDRALLEKTRNLLEITKGSIPKRNAKIPYPTPVLHLMHQTVLEFVLQFDFKFTILGPHAHAVKGNGHLFMAKSHILRGKPYDAMHQLYLYELTTGHTAKEFIDSIPARELGVDPKEGYSGHLGFAMQGGLLIYLQEKLRENPDAFRQTKEKLLRIAPGYGGIRAHVNLLQLLFDNGYSLSQDPDALSHICSYGLMTFGSTRPYSWITSLAWINGLDEIILLFIANGQNPAKKLTMVDERFTKKSGAARTNPFESESQISVSLIHLARTGPLVDRLIQYGLDINTLDSRGSTALDFIVPLIHYRFYAINKVSKLAESLMKAGAVTKTTTEEEWRGAISNVVAMGLDSELFRACFDGIEFSRKEQSPAIHEKKKKKKKAYRHHYLSYLIKAGLKQR